MKKNLTTKDLANIARVTMPSGSSVWLYGSRARGEARPDSDWDLLLLLDKDKLGDKDFERFCYPLIEFGWTFGADLSPQMYTKKEWEGMCLMPYYQNVERDKQVVYES